MSAPNDTDASLLARANALIAIGRRVEARATLCAAPLCASAVDEAARRVNFSELSNTDDEFDTDLKHAVQWLESSAAIDDFSRFTLLLRCATLRFRTMCKSKKSFFLYKKNGNFDVVARLGLNTALVICEFLKSADESRVKRARIDDNVYAMSDSALLWRAIGPVLIARRGPPALRSELVQFCCAYVIVQLMNASDDVPADVVQLTRDIAGAMRRDPECGDVRRQCRFAALLTAAHVELAMGAYEACVELCSSALSLVSRRHGGNAFYVRASARLAQRQWLGAMADFDAAVRVSYRFAASTLMREVSRAAAGGADWRAVAQAIARAAEQHSNGNSAAARADLDAATAMLNLALVFRAAERAEATATMLKLLADSCARERCDDGVSAELVLVCRMRTAALAPDTGVRLHSLCSVNNVGVQYLAAKAMLLAGQFETALNMYAQLATLCPLSSEPAAVAPLSLPSVDALQLHREWVCAMVWTGDAKRALTLCNKLVKVVDDPVIGLHRADAMVMLGLSQAALAQLDEIEQRLAALGDDNNDAARTQLRSVVRNNRALLHVRLGQLPAALKLLRLLVSAEPSNVTAAFNYCLLARSMGAAYECEACVVWLEARQLPVVDDPFKFADLAARRRAALERLDPSDRSCVEAQLAFDSAHDGAVSGAVTTRAALALDVSVLKRWCTLIADPRLQRRLSEAKSRH
jgi:tetratricopeptide (TPR) repeat protein